MTGALGIAIRVTRAATVLELTGELDVVTASEACRVIGTLIVPSGQSLIIDLSAVTFCDSSGISALLAARNLAVAASAAIALVNPPENLLRSLSSTGLTDVLPVYRSVESAEKA
ncbi:STAS domain-containing protein [Amycolatopsis sp. cmx-11-51]|uniref:STAS domain-containing protein n=1 Tax=unclassified Amycolatopsis TaxID=2618356 RepID=UPI0039E2CCF0